MNIIKKLQVISISPLFISVLLVLVTHSCASTSVPGEDKVQPAVHQLTKPAHPADPSQCDELVASSQEGESVKCATASPSVTAEKETSFKTKVSFLKSLKAKIKKNRVAV